VNDTPAEHKAVSWWGSLRRRKVVQWGLLYVAGAWGFLQGLEYVGDAFQWPPTVRQFALLAALVGLSVVLVIAWYHGDRGEQRIRRSELAIIALLCLLGGGIFWLYEPAEVTPTADRAGDPAVPVVAAAKSIAVLPFVNISGNVENEYFSDGITEELLNRLTLVSELQVTARTSAFYFKGKSEDVKKIGQALRVRHVVEGSVRRQGDRVRVTAQLVSTENGYRIWADTFDRRLEDVFAIQDEIALAIVNNLKLTLMDSTRAALAHRATGSTEALDLYLRAKDHYRSYDPERLDQALADLEEAIRIDPSYVAAYVLQAEALLARAHATLECCSPDAPWAAARRELLRQAIELDPSNADAIAMHGFDLSLAWDLEGAARELHRAEAISPNSEFVLRCLSLYYDMGGWPPERAIDYAARQFRLDPLNPIAATQLAAAYFKSYQLERALEALDVALELNPESWLAHWIRGAALIELERYEESLQSMERALAVNSGFTDGYSHLVWAYAMAGRMDEAQRLFDRIDVPARKPPWRAAWRAIALSALGRYDEAAASLEQAYRDNDGLLHEVLTYSVFIPMHDNPRFQRLARLLKVERRVQYTREMMQARRSRQT
jgi:TolB-like protein/Tfp pilus assembly protein PilF